MAWGKTQNLIGPTGAAGAAGPAGADGAAGPQGVDGAAGGLAPKVKSALKAQRAGMELMGRQAHKAQPALMRCQPMQVILPAWVQMD